MKTLKKGSAKQQMWIGKCMQCNAIVECAPGELHQIKGGDYRDNFECFSFGDCPDCCRKTSIRFVPQNSHNGEQLLAEVKA